MRKIILVLVVAVLIVKTPVFGQNDILKGDPSHYGKVYGLALRYNDYETAKDAVYNMLVENPANDSLQYALAFLYFQTNRYASAALSSQDLLARNESHFGALEICAVSFENLGLKDKALTHYEKLFLETDDFQTLYKMSFLQFDLKRYNECETNIDILMAKKEAETLTVSFNDEKNQQKEYPIKASLLNLKGLVAKEKGNKVLAKKIFEEALTIAPEFSIVKENLANIDQ